MTVFNDWRDIVFATSKSKGWHEIEVDCATHVANIHGEVDELWQAFRKGMLGEPCDKAEEMVDLGLGALTNAEEEVADIIIRALVYAAQHNIDVDRAVMVKDAFNRTRPYKHGGKKA